MLIGARSGAYCWREVSPSSAGPLKDVPLLYTTSEIEIEIECI